MGKFVGFVAATVAAICFGSNFVVIKEYDMGDGMYWQFIMAVGVWVCGMITCIARSPATSNFHPLALTSGVIWSMGNILTVTIIKTIGMALGMSIWCATQLVVGWATGKFGLLGTAKDTSVKNEWLNVFGILLVLASLILFFLVKPDNIDDEEHDKSYYKQGDDEDLHIPRTNAHIFNPNHAFDRAENEHTINSQRKLLIRDTSTMALKLDREIEEEMVSSWIDKLNSTQKNIVGVTCSVIAGICYGLMFCPVQYLINKDDDKYSNNMEDYVFTVYNGILLSALFYFLIYSFYMKNKPQINSRAVFPSILGAVVWAIAMDSYFLAMDKTNLGVETTFPIVSAGPQIVSSLWGVLYYKEIQGKKNQKLLWSAIFCSSVAIACIAMSKYDL